jgi:hypothetical protein
MLTGMTVLTPIAGVFTVAFGYHQRVDIFSIDLLHLRINGEKKQGEKNSS